MCGVVGIAYGRDNPALGRESASLVKHLEYRGYDSTGVGTMAEDGTIVLRKKVGAPSRVVQELGIEGMAGQKAIGQVRWATYGSVTDQNAQPHVVRCRATLLGAHNGNISNTDQLKQFLRERGHDVVSDNDGEMLVHVVEEYLAESGGVDALPAGEARVKAVEAAIRRANGTVVGSYAACFSVPGVPGVFAAKAGSSLYAGKGKDAAGPFVVVSSDLTSVLSKTRLLVPLSEGEGLWFDHESYRVFSLTDERSSVPPLRRSRLNVADIALHPPYAFFMEQEIAQAGPNLELLRRYSFPDPAEEAAFAAFEASHEDASALVFELLRVSGREGRDLSEAAGALVADPRLAALGRRAGRGAARELVSEEAALLDEIRSARPEAAEAVALLDLLALWKKKREVLAAKERALAVLRSAPRVFLVGSGTSYHACLAGASFLHDIAKLATHACNPGLFRSVALDALRPGDAVFGVTQSGETKDLVDVFNDVRRRHGSAVTLACLVNNENSTLPQEKSDFFLPILCGPEIAVAATKSFVSQMALFHLLAASLVEPPAAVAARLGAVRRAVDGALAATAADVDEVARALALRPSLHVLGTSLAGIAREGALKVREVVLNHTEGYDAAEFKHGPNTILGKNTVFGWEELRRAFADGARGGSFDEERYFSNYPLLFLCPPDERDVHITVSQIHTHKIRGADIVLVAEEDVRLRQAVEGRPDRPGPYHARMVAVPATGDRTLFAFQAAVVLQRLALRMSVEKMRVLDAAGVRDHGVHPDVPKNVSKSITVD